MTVNKEHDELSDRELMRYARQILLDDWDIDAQLNLKNSRVLIVGMGGLGCPVAQILVGAGVGSIELIDHDVIDESNLQRQCLYHQDDIGQYKSLIAQQRLQINNPFVKILAKTDKITKNNVHHLIGKRVDLVVDCSDNFGVRDVINRHCMTHDIPLLSHSAIGEIGQIALFERETGCYYCVFGDEMGDDCSCTDSGVLASTVHVIGAMTAQIALDFLGRHHNPIKNTLLLWQGKTMTLKQLHFHKIPHCHICGD